MKNIHILPTDKPSRLHNTFNVLRLERGFELSPCNQNIYITSDEEIKKDEWFIRKNKIHQLRWNDGYGNLYTKNGLKVYASSSKKIILTTDADLIKDGVQAIDDEFLEWFIKNPSCEEAEVEEHEIHTWEYSKILYKIIIPKEEPKQETLKEAAERIYTTELVMDVDISEDLQSAFINGAKWQQERSYSEEDMKSAFKIGFSIGYGSPVNGLGSKDETCDVWFEQFKKK